MPYGMTVDPKNFSVGMYCPNPVACPGGSLVASQSSLAELEPGIFIVTSRRV